MKPVLLSHTRVWRTYRGGRLLDELEGKSCPEDTFFPEDWLASVVEARNASRESSLHEGLSTIVGPEGALLRDWINTNKVACLGSDGNSMGLLAKLIDSSERLTIQVHPCREKAMTLFSSPYGKTESWYILGGRVIDGENPAVYIGFKPGITYEHWEKMFHSQDIQGMLNSLHRFEVNTGDVILVPGGVPHAIGSGCFILELQEPTDYSIRVERISPSGFQIDDFQCHQGLGFSRMLDCFDYIGETREAAKKRYFLDSYPIIGSENRISSILISYDVATYFSMEKHVVSGSTVIPITKKTCSVLFIASGKGEVDGIEVTQGDRMFVPASTKALYVTGNATFLQCFGSRRE